MATVEGDEFGRVRQMERAEGREASGTAQSQRALDWTSYRKHGGWVWNGQ